MEQRPRHGTMNTPALLAAAALLLLAADARADTPTPPSEAGRLQKSSQPNLALGLEAVTEFPIMLGGRLWLEMPGRLRLSSSLGVLPGAYSRVLGGLAQSVGGVDDEDVDLVRDTLSSSFIWRISVGWRPLPGRGGYLDVGYTHASLRAETDAATIQAAADVTIPAAVAIPAGDYGVRTISGGPDTPLARQITASAEAFLDEAFTSFRVIPTFTLAIGWHVWPLGGSGS